MIPDLLKGYCAYAPNRVALIEGERSLTFDQWFNLGENFAKYLLVKGLKGERIALHMKNSLELAIGYLGCLLSGAIAVPIQTTLKGPEIEFILDQTKPRLIYTEDGEIAHSIEKSKPETLLKNMHSSIPLKAPVPHEPAAIFFTSGSTSKPKGVTHSHASLFAIIETMAEAPDLTEKDRFLVSEPMTNVSGFSHIFLAPSRGGSSLIIPSFTIPAFLQALPLHPSIICVMGQGNSLILNDDQLKAEHFSGIRANFTGGDQITPAFMRAFFNKTGVPMLYGYGMSEFLVLTVNKSKDSSKLGSIGKEALHVEIKLLDQDGREVSQGETGEIWVRGPNCMLGYWNEEELTKRTIIDGWLRTGDLALRDADGYFWFVGRIKQIIKRGGDTISPLEVEEILSQHPAVNAVGVTGISDPEEGAVPYAFVELKPGCFVTEEELIALAKENLEDYKVPVRILFRETLPRTPSGKIARNNLKAD